MLLLSKHSQEHQLKTAPAVLREQGCSLFKDKKVKGFELFFNL